MLSVKWQTDNSIRDVYNCKRHVRTQHLFSTIRNAAGVFKIDCGSVIHKRKGRTVQYILTKTVTVLWDSHSEIMEMAVARKWQTRTRPCPPPPRSATTGTSSQCRCARRRCSILPSCPGGCSSSHQSREEEPIPETNNNYLTGVGSRVHQPISGSEDW